MSFGKFLYFVAVGSGFAQGSWRRGALGGERRRSAVGNKGWFMACGAWWWGAGA